MCPLSVGALCRGRAGFSRGLVGCILLLSLQAVAEALTSVTTYHNDPQRTGWNSSENILTPSKVTSKTFGLIASVALDAQVDAQPLVVANQTIAGQGVHTVVYVATEGNSVYAIDASSGEILNSVYLGAPVQTTVAPCTFIGLPITGILGTPTIDVSKQTIYLVADTLVGGTPTYLLHALNLQTLKDLPGSPVTVSASHLLVNGSQSAFNPNYQRQRPALLESSGNIYAAFGSFCFDSDAQSSRGWLLGWNAGTLAALNANELTNTLFSTDSNYDFYLSSIWMSGSGVAADSLGNVFFTTGNSDYQEYTYTGTTNIQESVVKMGPALTSVLDLFTPANVFTLDQFDNDYSAVE
jgi:hypothetical protein